MKFKYLLIPGSVPSQHSFWLRQEISFEDLVKKYALQPEDCKEGTEEIFFSKERIILRVRPFGDYLDYKARRFRLCLILWRNQPHISYSQWDVEMQNLR